MLINQMAQRAVVSTGAAPAATPDVSLDTARVTALPQQSAPPPQAQPVKIDVPTMAETMEVVVKQIESFLKGNERSLRFSIDDTTGRTVISVRDAASGDLIRQIPGEDALRIARALASGKSLLDLTV